jgi:hypothetical protein
LNKVMVIISDYRSLTILSYPVVHCHRNSAIRVDVGTSENVLQSYSAKK